jgi:peptide/nickel transport system substrate-binding protein
MLYHVDLRKAVSLAVSRMSLVENAFMSHARAAVFPFNSSWDALSGLPEPNYAKYESDPNAADALLATLQAGTGGGPLYYNLIVQESNNFLRQAAEQIAEQLAMVNLNVTVNTLSDDDFRAALREGAYDFYLSEIKLTKNMDLSPFFSPGGAAAWGIDLTSLDIGETYRHYKAGQTELPAFLAAFDETMPFIPLLYRNGQFCYSRSIKSGVAATEDRLYMNIAEWKI